jgi:ABC-type lipoprotein release transport system permease subunit
MRQGQLVARGLRYYWRTNLAVIAGVATAVAVLAGALLVGDSVRGSLRDLVLQRLGATDVAVVSAGFFRAQLAQELEHPAAPLVILPGVVTAQESGRRAGNVRVYGVDDRFWEFHGIADVAGPAERELLVSPALAGELAAEPGMALLVRVQRPSDVPLESLHGRKDDTGRTLRLTVRAVVETAMLGEFSLEAQQAAVRAVFVPLSRLQQELEIDDRVNTVLVALDDDQGATGLDRVTARVRATATLEDLGLRVRSRGAQAEGPPLVIVESDAGLLDDAQAATAHEAFVAAGFAPQPVFTYLANTMRIGMREVPYSLLTATDLAALPTGANAAPGVIAPPAGSPPPIVLTRWTADDLQARVGDRLQMEYLVWEEPGQLVTRITELIVSGVVPTTAGDRDLAPVMRGISDSPTLADWEPPFPIDLRRIRPVDEDYWERYRTTPKAFVALDTGQQLWRSRYGAMTSIRAVVPPDAALTDASAQVSARLRASLDPLAAGLAVRDVRGEGLAASTGATDFGAYFVYFSFFLVVSALLLASLFFKLGVEQRVREVGLLRAVGWDPRAVRNLFLREGLVLALIGSALGVLGAVAYAWLLMLGLRSWWVDAVGTTALTLHVAPISLVAGAAGGVIAAVGCIWWTLRSLSSISERSLLAGDITTGPEHLVSGVGRAFTARPARRKAAPYGSTQASASPDRPPARWTRQAVAAGVLTVIGGGLVIAALAGVVGRAGAFFGAAAALLVASLCLAAALLRRRPTRALGGHGWRPVSGLGLRNATYRPGRSVLSMAVIASATFILISVDAFRRDSTGTSDDPRSGTGGYELLVESLLPVVHDPNTDEGREALNLSSLDDSVTLEPFRLLPGDDASCLNLYVPRNPRILAPRDSFLEAGRFAFQGSLAESAEHQANPWLLLQGAEADGAVPVIADANSMTYVLHRRLGEDIVIMRGDREIRLRLVASLRDSIFQGELLMSQANFQRLFPEQEGYHVLLADTPPGRSADVSMTIENALTDSGADAVSTGERLAEFHRVENTYLSTFQTLGGLGLILGTLGLATVLLRNALERRRELALLGAVGYRRAHFTLMVAAENALLLAGGLLAGAASAVLAIAPAAIERGVRVPLSSTGALLLFAVFVAGLLSSLVAARAVTRAPLLESLRSDT